MKKSRLVFWRLYLPLITFVVLVVTSFFIEMSPGGSSVSIGILGFFEVEAPVENKALVRTVTIALSMLSIAPYALYDYSQFYSNVYEIRIYFDKKGIEKRLNNYTDKEKRELGIREKYEEGRMEYYRFMDESLEKAFEEKEEYYKTTAFYSASEGLTKCTGISIFNIKRVGGGLQHYRISEGFGKITQKLEKRNEETFSFLSFFELEERSDNFIRGNLIDIMLNRSKLIYPSYKQYLAENVNSDKEIYHHVLTASMKLYFFPYPTYSDTLS